MADRTTADRTTADRTTADRAPAERVPAVKADDGARKRARKKLRREPGRWVREAKGILALAFAGFAVVALYAHDPARELLDQTSPVGPIGGWLGGGLFWAFGQAGYLLPALAALYGIAAFVRPRIAA